MVPIASQFSRVVDFIVFWRYLVFRAIQYSNAMATTIVGVSTYAKLQGGEDASLTSESEKLPCWWSLRKTGQHFSKLHFQGPRVPVSS